MDVERSSWLTAAGTGGGYLLILVLLTILLFALPYAIFAYM